MARAVPSRNTVRACAFRSLAAVCAVVLGLALDAGAAAADPDPGSLSGNVSGYASEQQLTAQPIAGVVVSATGSGATYTVVTDGSGNFEIDGLPSADAYSVTFTPPSGYQPQTITGVQIAPDGDTSE